MSQHAFKTPCRPHESRPDAEKKERPHAGPSAVLAALVGSGLPTDAFQFAGFLPARSGQRLKRLEQLAGKCAFSSGCCILPAAPELRQGACWADVPVTLIFYAPPHSLEAVLADMGAALSGRRQCVVAREITKVQCAPYFCHMVAPPRLSFRSSVRRQVHEEFFRGTLTEAATEFTARQCKVRMRVGSWLPCMHEGDDTPDPAWPQGEVTIVVEGCVAAGSQATAVDIEQHLSKLLQEGHPPSRAARMAAKTLGVPRNDAYDAAVRLGKG